MTIRNVYLATESGDEYTAKIAKLYPRYVAICGVQISLDNVNQSIDLSNGYYIGESGDLIAVTPVGELVMPNE